VRGKESPALRKRASFHNRFLLERGKKGVRERRKHLSCGKKKENNFFRIKGEVFYHGQAEKRIFADERKRGRREKEVLQSRDKKREKASSTGPACERRKSHSTSFGNGNWSNFITW